MRCQQPLIGDTCISVSNQLCISGAGWFENNAVSLIAQPIIINWQFLFWGKKITICFQGERNSLPCPPLVPTLQIIDTLKKYLQNDYFYVFSEPSPEGLVQ